MGQVRTHAPHKGRTFIGRIERGFDFLGYHFGPAGLAVAAKTVANFIERGVSALRARVPCGITGNGT